jgi:hypothetical protein
MGGQDRLEQIWITRSSVTLSGMDRNVKRLYTPPVHRYGVSWGFSSKIGLIQIRKNPCDLRDNATKMQLYIVLKLFIKICYHRNLPNQLNVTFVVPNSWQFEVWWQSFKIIDKKSGHNNKGSHIDFAALHSKLCHHTSNCHEFGTTKVTFSWFSKFLW